MMSLDDDLAPWVAEALDHGQNPEFTGPNADLDREQHVKQQVASWLGRYDDTLSDKALLRLAGRIVHGRVVLVSMLKGCGPDRSRVRLRSEQVQATTAEDAILQELAYLTVEVERRNRWLREMKSQHAPPEHDPDERNADADDRVLSVAHFDEAASANGPDLGTVA